jgi:hypothetical protein
MDRPTVLPLRCPDCGGVLDGLPQDVVFWCANCAAVQELVGTGFVRRQGAIAQARRSPSGPVCHLPIWALRTRAAWTWPATVKASDLVRRLAEPAWVYVTAFALHNAFYFGDPGLIFTQRQVVLKAGERAPLLGCTRSLETAVLFVEPHLLSIVDRRVDVTGIALQCAVDEAILWGIPFSDTGGVLADGILGLTIPAAAVNQIGALRAWRSIA